MSVKINYRFALPPEMASVSPHASNRTFPTIYPGISYELAALSNLSTPPSAPFEAKPRPKMAWTAADYAICALKIVFFPITAIHYLVCYLCSMIAFHHGVKASKNVDESKLSQLKEWGGQKVQFFSEDKVLLQGMHFTNPRPIPNAQTVLICSGSHHSHEEYTVPMVDALLKQGHHVMVFNYRGFGKSSGSPSEEGFYLDAEAAYQYIKTVHKKSDDQITVLGYSMGSGPATDLAANHKIKLILDRYFSSMRDVATDEGGLPAKAIFYLGNANFDVKEKIKKVQGGIFLARGSFDSMTKPYQVEHLKSALASHPKTSFVTVRSSHLHGTNSGLWFHPANTANTAERQQLLKFLSS
jgi:esterase/lipase